MVRQCLGWCFSVTALLEVSIGCACVTLNGLHSTPLASIFHLIHSGKVLQVVLFVLHIQEAITFHFHLPFIFIQRYMSFRPLEHHTAALCYTPNVLLLIAIYRHCLTLTVSA